MARVYFGALGILGRHPLHWVGRLGFLAEACGSCSHLGRRHPYLGRTAIGGAKEGIHLGSTLIGLGPKTPPNHSPKPHPKQPQNKPQKTAAFHLRSTHLSATQSPFIPSIIARISRCTTLLAAISAAIILDRSQQRSFAAKSYQQRSFAAIGLHSSPQQSFAANYLDRGQHRSEHDQQQSLALYCRCPPPQQPCTPLPVFLLLQPHPCCNQRHQQPRSRSAAVADITAALFFLHHHCCLPTQTSRLPSSDRYQPPEKIAASTTLQHHRRTPANVTATIFFLHHCCYPWLPSFTWRLHHRSPDIDAIRCLQPENCSYTLQSVYLIGWRSLCHDIGGLIRSQIGGFRDAYGC
ncbi:hypothetical protein B296_00008295 [Ensete ventricosum]|uniref:Uncharacterized protein n=1 Tax=Ensete ventricosum TaxID=4639 RepID=A0A426YL96_ENSVE|nr:hypothetical protein B296_00008295 [Ensete ventricosum]